MRFIHPILIPLGDQIIGISAGRKYSELVEEVTSLKVLANLLLIFFNGVILLRNKAGPSSPISEWHRYLWVLLQVRETLAVSLLLISHLT